jgi:hypothetical protein
MARTRLVALNIGDVRIAIEAPPALPWRLGAARLDAFAVPAADADLHLGVRVGRVDCSRRPDLSDAGRERLEVHRHGSGWQVLHRRRGRVEREARFDGELRTGEVILDAGSAAARDCSYPLASPLDEWIVRHRLARSGGILLAGCVGVRDGRATLFVGAPFVGRAGLAAVLEARDDVELLADGLVAVRADGTGFRVHSTPWSRPEAVRSAPLEALHRVEAGPGAVALPLVAEDAIAALLGVCPPVDDPAAGEAMLRTVERLGERVATTHSRVVDSETLVELAWGLSPGRLPRAAA